MPLTRPQVISPWADAGDKVAPTTPEVSAGWPVTNIPPSRQRFNWILNALHNGVRYLTRRGLADWSALEDYKVGDRCLAANGMTYRCVADHINVVPGTDATKWERWGFTIAELPNLDQVVNNTYIGPTPQKQRVFTSSLVLSDMPIVGTSYVCQTLTFTGARRARINGHAAFRNNAGSSCNVTMTLKLNGSSAIFGGHYLGAILTPTSGANTTQIPISISDFLSGLNPGTTYTLTLEAAKQQSVGPIEVQDAYLDIEYV